MAKWRFIFQCFLVVGLVCGLNLRPAQASGLNPDNRPAPSARLNPDDPNPLPPQEIPESYEPVAENENFQLFANRASLAFKVLDKRSGYIWHSNLDEKITGDRLNKTWMAFASSGISIDYLDEKALSERVSITNTEPEITFTPTGQGFEAAITFLEPSISLVLQVRLEEAGVSVEIPFASINQADPAFKLGTLYVYPFLGAIRGDSLPGYMFIPDGPGSLIRFSNTTKAVNMYYGRYYGADLGMLGVLPFDPTINRPDVISYPVFGMVHGEKEHAFLSIVEKGASYGEVQAHPAGIITNFNFLYSAFLYNESYFQATNRSGAGVTTLQQNTNAFDIKIHYRFLTGEQSDYVGMARSYQQYLVEKGQLTRRVPPSPDISIKLEVLGGEKEKVLFWYRLISMTTVDQMTEMLDNLDIKNPEVVFYGWQKLGASSMPPKSLKIDPGLGSLQQVRSLVEKIQARGGNFSFYLDPQAAIRGESGYSTRYDLAMAITNINLLGYNRYKVNYYLNLDAVAQRFSTLSAQAASEVKAGLAVDGLGNRLYSDFKPNHVLNREQAIEQYQSLVAAAAAETRLAFYQPNDYLLGFTRAYYDMPLTNSGYIYTTDSVPFLPIVLSGYIPYFGKALNFSSDTQTDLLRHVEYGVYPSFFLTQEVTARILKTPSNWIYTSSYEQWSEEINRTYHWLNNLLGPVRGQTITAREFLKNGVAAVSYENGQQIIVNYTNQPFQVDGLVVAARDAIIREVVP